MFLLTMFDELKLFGGTWFDDSVLSDSFCSKSFRKKEKIVASSTYFLDPAISPDLVDRSDPLDKYLHSFHFSFFIVCLLQILKHKHIKFNKIVIFFNYWRRIGCPSWRDAFVSDNCHSLWLP